MKNHLRIIRKDTGEIIANRVRPARTPWARMKGLLGVKSLPPGEGIWLTPCNSIHMWGMSIPIDVLFLDRSLRVVRCVPELKPGAVVWPVRGAHSVVELGCGTLQRTGPLEGVALTLETTAD